MQGNIISLVCVSLVKMEYLAMNDRIPGTTWDNPIWFRDRWRIYLSGMDYPGLEYEYMHDDYDGDSDTENRAGHCESIEACKQEIHDRFYSRDGK